MQFSPANITALIVAASFAGGLNIYATVLTLGVLARTHWVALPPGLSGVGNTWVIVTCAVLFVIEFFADKIPGFDVIWNGLQTVVRIPVAGLIAYHASSQLSPSMQLFATAIGAGIALATHSSKTLARTAVTPSPEPVSNIALSSVEDIIAIGITWVATTHPIVAATIAGGLLIATFFVGRALFRVIRRSLQKLFGTDEEDAVHTEQKPLG